MKRLLFVIMASILLAPSLASAYGYIHPCGPRWANLPVQFWINDNGSNDIPQNTLDALVSDSFDEWGDPCCSSFDATYQGRTGLTAQNNNGRVVLSWEENQWPQGFGSVNVTIGVTLTQIFNNCTFAQAPILFNGVGFRFSTDGSFTDIQSIVTHEVGHLTGLDHSEFQTATMFASYIGGTGARSLEQDDVDGVCSLYQNSCSCNSNANCSGGQVCINNLCVVEPCNNQTNPCDPGLECNNGECTEPTCAGDAECDPGFICFNQRCRSECAACAKCNDDADCGQNGFCVSDGVGGNSCIVLCDAQNNCPGDSTCYQVQTRQGPVSVCGAPNTQQDLCPANYICYLNGQPDDECAVDGDCEAGEVCVSSGGVLVCREGENPCDSVMCADDETCVDGVCIRQGENNANNANNANNGTANNGGGTSNNGGGGNNNGQNTIIVLNDDATNEPGCCATTADRKTSGGWLALIALGLLGFTRRRRG